MTLNRQTSEYGRRPYLIRMNLSLFAGEKTEKATPKRKSEARKEGQVAKSQELGTAFLFISVFIALRSFAPYMLGRLSAVFARNFVYMEGYEDLFTRQAISGYIAYCFLQIIVIAAPVVLVALVAGLICNVVQVGWKPTSKPLRPKLSKLDPIKGFKKLFSMRSLIELVKSLAKFAIVGSVIYATISGEFAMIGQLMNMELYDAAAFIASTCVSLGLNVGMLYLFIAAADYGYNRWKHNKDLRMSKQDIKDEYKMSEGDPHVKGRIKQKMREAAMRRMMHDVPSADVIITNPTHFAVALKYDKERGEAPILVAKGADFVAKRIREKAAEAGVPLVENPPLARALYNTVDIGREIPPSLYQAVAEVLAYVFRLKNAA